MTGFMPTFLTRRRAPDDLDDLWYSEDAETASSPTAIADWRLYHYLSSGGIHAFANTSLKKVVLRRQKRFLWLSAFLLALWFALRFV